MNILTLRIQILIFAALLVWLMYSLKNFKIYEALRNTFLQIEETKERIRFMDETALILARSMGRMKQFRNLEAGAYPLGTQRQIDKWYELSRVSRAEARADSVLLEKYPDAILQDLVTAKRLLVRLICVQIELSQDYDRYVQTKFEHKGEKNEDAITRRLSQNLVNVAIITNLLKDYYEKKLDGT